MAGQLLNAELQEMSGPQVTTLLTPGSARLVWQVSWAPVLKPASQTDGQADRPTSMPLGEHHPFLMGAASSLCCILPEISFPGSCFSLDRQGLAHSRRPLTSAGGWVGGVSSEMRMEL